MKKSISIIWIFVCFLISCTRQQYSPEIESVLEQAGDNRSELEQVLQHYSQDPADSLKLKAAEFLIINMPNKYPKYIICHAPRLDTVFMKVKPTNYSIGTVKSGNRKERRTPQFILCNIRRLLMRCSI
jgi:hypothetical protein